MKLSIEIESEDAVELCIFHNDMLNELDSKIAPELYSLIERITISFMEQVATKITDEDFERIKQKVEAEKQSL